ncbi:MAG: hypothetical protein KAI27_01700 [Rhodospirillaceae bacterium]|nr:hypothetical protein [Rhodospirillaceae bacterium]
MPYAAQVTQRIFDEATQAWIDSPNPVLITADSIDWAEETDDGDTHIKTKSGDTIRVKQSLNQMETFLNMPREVEVIP